MTIRITGWLATIVDKCLGNYQDNLGIFCWTPEDEKFLLNSEMEYYKLTGINPYETPDCPKGFEQDAINFRERLEHDKHKKNVCSC
jgi:hypothetical protein